MTTRTIETLRTGVRASGDDRGQIAIGFALLIVVVFMFFALAFDAGLWYFDHRAAQNQVDAAAHAGAIELPNIAMAEASAITYLQQNGITNPTDPANLCPGKPAARAWDENGDGKLDVEVCQRRASGVVFSALSNVTGAMVSARAVATQYLEPVRYAIMVMDPDECQAFSVGGNAVVAIQDGSGTGAGGASLTRSNATCPSGALSVGGSGLHLTGLSHDVNGSVSACAGCIAGTVNSPAPEFQDPWASLTPPAVGACMPGSFTFNNGSHVLTPGTYCSDITIGGGAKVTVRPGVYVLRDADMTVSPSAGPGGFFCLRDVGVATCTSADDASSLNPNEALFYSTCNPSPCAGANRAGTIDFGGGGGRVRLNGHAAYDRIVFWIDRTSNAGTPSTTEIKIVGSSTTVINGHVYAFSSDANVSGGSSGTPALLNVSIMANTLSFTGNSNLVLNWDPTTAPKIKRIALTE